MPASIRPKGKAQKIRDAVMGPLPNEPRTRVSKKGKKSKIKQVLDFEQTSRTK